MAEPFNEAAFRVAVDMWWNNPDRATTHRILTGARHVLGRLDEARADRDGFVEEIRDLNDQLERVRALHTPDKNGECTACDESFDPCSTIRALDGTEADQ